MTFRDSLSSAQVSLDRSASAECTLLAQAGLCRAAHAASTISGRLSGFSASHCACGTAIAKLCAWYPDIGVTEVSGACSIADLSQVPE